jgi:hypothetical protein
MVGKSIRVSDDTYLYIELREGFVKLRGVLSLTLGLTKNSLSDVEELADICSETIATSLKPTIRKMLLERMMKGGTDNKTVGFLQMPNLDTDVEQGASGTVCQTQKRNE